MTFKQSMANCSAALIDKWTQHKLRVIWMPPIFLSFFYFSIIRMLLFLRPCAPSFSFLTSGFYSMSCKLSVSITAGHYEKSPCDFLHRRHLEPCARNYKAELSSMDFLAMRTWLLSRMSHNADNLPPASSWTYCTYYLTFSAPLAGI